MDWTRLEPEIAAFQALTQKVIAAWHGGGDCELRPLGGGASGAAVFRADFRPNPPSSALNGKYILKVSRHSKWPDQPNEIDAHVRATTVDPQFAKTHIPELLNNIRLGSPDDDSAESGYAMLYRVAGGSLDSFRAASGKDSSGLVAIAQRLSLDLLNRWAHPVPDKDGSPGTLLVTWLGYRLSTEQAPELHSFANRDLGTSNSFSQSGEALVHPLRFAERLDGIDSLSNPVLSGLLHNDLHGGNLLYYTLDPGTRDYQIIDFGLSDVGPTGFDHAYLEVATLIEAFRASDVSRLIGVLKALDQPERNNPLPDGSFWAFEVLKRLREGIAFWKRDTMKDRVDDVDRQFMLARVAAGINWANKKGLDESDRYLALCYAGWSAKQYIEGHAAGELAELLSNTNNSSVNTKGENHDQELWSAFFEAANQFSRHNARFVLVAESLKGLPNIEGLGFLPWSAIIDLDPDSDHGGLFELAAPRLRSHRAIHIFEGTRVSSVSRGCSWLFACGRKVASKPPEPLASWIVNGLRNVRSLIESLYASTVPVPLNIIILPGATLDPRAPLERLTRIADAAYEASGGKAHCGFRCMWMEYSDKM